MISNLSAVALSWCALVHCVISQLASHTYYSEFDLSEDLNVHLWVRFRSWVDGITYRVNATPWYYVGPLNAGFNSISIDVPNQGIPSYGSQIYFGFYGTGKNISTTLSNFKLEGCCLSYYIWGEADTTLSCTADADSNECCIFQRDTYLETENYFDFQSNGGCDNAYLFESQRDGPIPTSEPTTLPTAIPTASPTLSPTTIIETTTIGSTADNGDSAGDDLNEDGDESGIDQTASLLFGLGIGLICLTMVFGCYFMRSSRKKDNHNHNHNHKHNRNHDNLTQSKKTHLQLSGIYKKV